MTFAIAAGFKRGILSGSRSPAKYLARRRCSASSVPLSRSSMIRRAMASPIPGMARSWKRRMTSRRCHQSAQAFGGADVGFCLVGIAAFQRGTPADLQKQVSDLRCFGLCHGRRTLEGFRLIANGTLFCQQSFLAHDDYRTMPMRRGRICRSFAFPHTLLSLRYVPAGDGVGVRGACLGCSR